MKKIILSSLLFAAAVPAWSADAADASKPLAPLFKMQSAGLRSTTNNAEAGSTEILSKSAYFDLKARTAIYLGDVRVRDPRMELACEILTVKLSPQGGGKFDSGIAETNVVIDFIDDKGQKIHATGGKVIYRYNATATYTNDVMELMDNPLLHTPQVDWSGGVITFDRINNTIKADHSRMIIRQPPDSTNTSFFSPAN